MGVKVGVAWWRVEVGRFRGEFGSNVVFGRGVRARRSRRGQWAVGLRRREGVCWGLSPSTVGQEAARGGAVAGGAVVWWWMRVVVQWVSAGVV